MRGRSVPSWKSFLRARVSPWFPIVTIAILAMAIGASMSSPLEFPRTVSKIAWKFKEVLQENKDNESVETSKEEPVYSD